jgi:hypothetical protein
MEQLFAPQIQVVSLEVLRWRFVDRDSFRS